MQLGEVEDAARSSTSFQASSSNASGCRRKTSVALRGQRAVHVHRHVQVVLLEDLAQEVEKLLRPPHGEGRDDDVAPVALGLLEDLGQPVLRITVALVQAVAVGGLHDEVVGLL